MKFNLTIKALRSLRVQLGISRYTLARTLRIPETTFKHYEIEQSPMPENVHSAYENFLFDVLNGERVVDCRKNQVWTLAQKQACKKYESALQCKELSEARMLIKEYETLLNMYRKERI